MADWHLTDIRFVGNKPTADELKKLNEAAQAVDYDFPKITEYGVHDAMWRSPLVLLEEIMCLFHRAGFPCEGWSEMDYGDDEYFWNRPRTPKASDPDFIVRKDDLYTFDSAWNEVMNRKEENDGN